MGSVAADSKLGCSCRIREGHSCFFQKAAEASVGLGTKSLFPSKSCNRFQSDRHSGGEAEWWLGLEAKLSSVARAAITTAAAAEASWNLDFEKYSPHVKDEDGGEYELNEVSDDVKLDFKV